MVGHECFVLEEVSKWTAEEQKIFWFYMNTEGMSRLYTAYLQQNKKTTQHFRSEWPEVRSSVLESVKRAKESENTDRLWFIDKELYKVASKTLQSIKNKYFFRRCKKNIGGSVLRKHGISWIRVGNGIFVPATDGEKYPVDRITGVLFEYQYPHPFSLP